MVIDKARELGIALSESAEYERMLASRDAIEKDAALTALINEFGLRQQQLAEMLSDAELEGSTSLEAASHDIDNIQQMLLENVLFSEMLEAQSAFQKLMRRVNKVIGVCIGLEDTGCGDEAGCSGSCASCPGCTH